MDVDSVRQVIERDEVHYFTSELAEDGLQQVTFWMTEDDGNHIASWLIQPPPQ